MSTQRSRKTGPAETDPSATPASAATADPSFRFEKVPAASILEALGGDCREDTGDVEALAESIRRRGLLQPIVVFRAGDGSYNLAAGRRRLAAVRLLGWDRVPARVFPAAGEEIREAVSAVENLDRRDLTPVEEALSVVRLAETLGVKGEDLERGGGDSAALEQAAALLGRSVAWVRERGMLLRLCPQVRALVASRRLPLAQAREIAKLASTFDQEAVAEAATSSWDWRRGDDAQTEADGVRVQSLVEVRQAVASRLSTLRGVPWKPDVDFAGRPACAMCPDNSANSLLFGADADDGAPEARCLNTRCYETKMRAAEKAMRVFVEKAAKDADVRPTAAGVRDLAPDYLKPATVARNLKRLREPSKPKGRSTADTASGGGLPWEKTPGARYSKAWNKWSNKVRRQVEAAIVAEPMRLACFLLAVASPTYNRHIGWAQDGPTKAQRKKIEPLLKRAVRAKMEDLNALAKDFARSGRIGSPMKCPLWIARHLAGLLSISLDPEPKQEDFLPKPAAKAAAPEPKRKSRKAKKEG